MKFVFPIEKKEAKDLHIDNRKGPGGYYPIGMNKTYHGGVHLHGADPVVAVTDGAVFAYRYTKACCEETSAAGKTYRYSNCFILIRHTHETPKKQKLTFYSLYHHLCPWDELNDDVKKRMQGMFTKPGMKIMVDGLRVRSSMDTSSDDNLVDKKLGRGDMIAAAKQGDRWAKIDGAEEYFVFTNKGRVYAEEANVAADPVFDEIVVADIPVKAGAVLGTPGLYEGAGIPENYSCTHVEVFAGDDAPAFVKNAAKDGDKKPTLIEVKKGAELKVKQARYTPAQVKSTLHIPENTFLSVLDAKHPAYIQVREHTLESVVNHDHIAYDKVQKNYSIVWDHVKSVSASFGDYEFEKSDRLVYAACADASGKRLGTYDSSAPKRYIRFTLPQDKAETMWIRRSAVGDVKGEEVTVEQEITETFAYNPAAVKFEKSAGMVAEGVPAKIKDLETMRDDDDLVWYHVKTGVDGWIAENNASVSALSAFDWPSFKIAKEEGGTAHDPIIDLENLSPFFKSVVDEINTDKDKTTISKDEMVAALKDEKLAFKLSRLICFHQSEWWVDSEMKYWDAVFRRIGKHNTANLKERLKNICWWDEVSQKVDGFPGSPSVYHWHPVAFVENMKFIQDTSLQISTEQLTDIMEGINEKKAVKFTAAFNELMPIFEINTKLRQAHFLAQVAHETGHLKYMEEIASGAAYEGRKDLGNTETGDGKRFKGRGIIQLTGRKHYTSFQAYLRQNVEKYKRFDLLSGNNARKVANAFFLPVMLVGGIGSLEKGKRLLNASDKDDVFWVSVFVNGWAKQKEADRVYKNRDKEPNNMKHRIECLKRAKKSLDIE